MNDSEVEARMGGRFLPLRHGRWSLEVRGDEVADIAYDGVPLLRAVRPVVRDRDWNTVPVSVLVQQHTDDSTTLVTRLRFAAADTGYDATVTVTLDDDGVRVDFLGRASTTFARNRIGLVVLHPATDAGQRVDVRHADGRVEAGRWPIEISPHQPFRDIAGFQWQRNGVTAELALSGDVFETEDQRNWTDASFKTYSTPLSLAFPVTIRVGDTCHQQVRITAEGAATSRPPRSDQVVRISDQVIGTLPPISLGANVHAPPSPPSRNDAGYDTVLVELTGPEDGWPAMVRAAVEQADALRTSLDVRLVTADPAAVDRGLALLPLTRVVRLAAFDPTSHLTTAPLWRGLTASARERAFAGQLVAGTRAHFTELNRQFPELPPDAPALTFSLTPQMHATEVPHIVDSLATQSTVAANAIRLAGGRPVHVGPITLARRFNAVATTGPTDPATEAARAVDPLISTDFAAAWTLGSVAALAPTGIASLCYFETIGPRGVTEDNGTTRPVGVLLDQLAALRGQPMLEVSSPDGTAALAISGNGGSLRLLVANLSANRRTVAVHHPTGASHALRLGPWAVSDTVIAADAPP